MHARSGRLLLAALTLLLAGCASSSGGGSVPLPSSASTPPGAPAPSSAVSARPARWTPAHVVVVVEENRSYGDVMDGADAPYLHQLAASGASLLAHHAVTHPSEPNYLALFSGSTQGLTDDTCPHRYPGPDLAAQLIAVHRSFAGYAEGLPRTGYSGCTAGAYAARHAPWTAFADVPAAAGQPFTAFPADYSRLPSLSFVIPDLDHDMHDGTVAQCDAWLRAKLAGYATWARTHDSLLVVTWDEDDRSADNRIPTVIVGAHVRHTTVGATSDHYGLLRTLEWLFGLPGIGTARDRVPLTQVFAT